MVFEVLDKVEIAGNKVKAKDIIIFQVVWKVWGLKFREGSKFHLTVCHAFWIFLWSFVRIVQWSSDLIVVPRGIKSISKTPCRPQNSVAIILCRSSVWWLVLTLMVLHYQLRSIRARNIIYLAINICEQCVSCSKKMYHWPYLTRCGQFNILKHFKATRQSIHISYRAAAGTFVRKGRC